MNKTKNVLRVKELRRMPNRRAAQCLQQIGLFGCMDVEHGCLRFEKETDAMESDFTRWGQDGYVVSEEFYDNRVVYRLTSIARDRLQEIHNIYLSRSVTRPLRPGRVIRRWALLHFCTRPDGSHYDAYRPTLDVERFPDLNKMFRDHPHFNDPLKGKIFYRHGDAIGLFVLYRGARVDTFLQNRLWKPFRTLSKFPEFVGIARNGDFEVSIMTADSDRGDQINEAIDAKKPPFKCEVVVKERLAEVLINVAQKNPPSSSAKRRKA